MISLGRCSHDRPRLMLWWFGFGLNTRAGYLKLIRRDYDLFSEREGLSKTLVKLFGWRLVFRDASVDK